MSYGQCVISSLRSSLLLVGPVVLLAGCAPPQQVGGSPSPSAPTAPCVGSGCGENGAPPSSGSPGAPQQPSAGGSSLSVTEPSSYDAPIKITKGGVYSGNWRTDDMDTPAVSVETSEPVTIENCHISHNGPGIWSPWSHARLTVRNCSFHGKAANVDGRERGRAISIPAFVHLQVENNFFENTGNVVAVDGYSGDGTAAETLLVRYNKVRNIDGRYRDGGRTLVNFVSVQNFMNAQGNPRFGEIAWNDVVNLPDKSSTEDLINFYQAGGRVDSSFKVHDNLLKGSYPTPATNPEATGSGIQIDGKDHTKTAYIEVFSNTIMQTLNGGMGAAAGQHIHMHDNRVISSGKDDAGNYWPGNFGGVWTFNFYSADAVGTMTDIVIDHNVIGWASTNYAQPFDHRYDVTVNFLGGIHDNTQLPDAPITKATEDAEVQAFLDKVVAASVKVGPQAP